MIKNEQYTQFLNSIISCINNNDYYSIKELAMLEIEKMQRDNKLNQKNIKKIKLKKHMKKTKKYINVRQYIAMNLYITFLLDKINKAKDVSELKRQIISLYEFKNIKNI